MYKVEKICAFRYNEGEERNQYLVKWLGYNARYNTWEPESNLSNCKEEIYKFKTIQQMKEINKHIKVNMEKGVESLSSNEENYQPAQEMEIFEPRKRGRPIKYVQKKRPTIGVRNCAPSSQTPSKKKPIQIRELSRNEAKEKIFLIKIDNQMKWVERSFLFPTYSDQLVMFYEAHLHLK